MNKIIIMLVFAVLFIGCNNTVQNEQTKQEEQSVEKKSFVDSLKNCCQSLALWTTDLNEGSGMINPVPSIQNSELLYSPQKKEFYLREQYIDNRIIRSDTAYVCNIKKTKKGTFLIMGIGDECSFEIINKNKVEGIWPDFDNRTHSETTISIELLQELLN